ncbi:hypothetical protein TWF788_002712 [Orbilia oligospora]|uniref:Uncharacterized protein n=1 Tax=Orbilia oligospora TaxID=2813651 RepID=A0A7C8PAC9_ORBOL|nr:hypothetical protein TWF788_002712 [Orbilia oligospora]
MAPLGLLTAVVSVIRVCGSASLRAFIGRAQESSGFAEIEVLSCTSATTGELFNARGGIARVFGSPQILEVVVTKPNDPDKPEFEVTTLQNAKKSWVKVEPRRGGNNRQEKADTTEELEALLDNLECQPSYRSPNLSLNVGIAKIPQEIIYLAAVFGMVLQTGVLIFAILTTHPKFVHRFTDPEENGPRPSYGLPFTLVGTILYPNFRIAKSRLIRTRTGASASASASARPRTESRAGTPRIRVRARFGKSGIGVGAGNGIRIRIRIRIGTRIGIRIGIRFRIGRRRTRTNDGECSSQLTLTSSIELRGSSTGCRFVVGCQTSACAAS